MAKATNKITNIRKYVKARLATKVGQEAIEKSAIAHAFLRAVG